MVDPVRAGDIWARQGLDDANLQLLDKITGYINGELGKPEHWKTLFGNRSSLSPNPNPGVTITIPDLEKVIDTQLTDELREALVRRFSDVKWGWEVQDCHGANPPALVFHAR